MAGKCGFFQSENYTLDEQNCLQEVSQKKAEYTRNNATVEGICVDMEIHLEKKGKTDDFRRTGASS
jgi:hypothetical protein